MVSNLTGEGYVVGAIKHIYHKDFKVDEEGTNTWRYAKAGAKVVTAISAEEIVIIRKTEANINDLKQVVGLLRDEKLDIIVVEGFRGLVEKRKDVLKIVTAKDEDSLRITLGGIAQPVIAVTGVIGQQKPQIELDIPLINIPAEGKKLLKLVKEYLTKIKFNEG